MENWGSYIYHIVLFINSELRTITVFAAVKAGGGPQKICQSHLVHTSMYVRTSPSTARAFLIKINIILCCCVPSFLSSYYSPAAGGQRQFKKNRFRSSKSVVCLCLTTSNSSLSHAP